MTDEPDHDRDLSVDHLQLGSRAFKRLKRLGLARVGEVEDALSEGRITVEDFGKATYDDVVAVISEMDRCRTEEGVDWLKFIGQRPPSDKRVAFTTPSLRRLHHSERDRTIGTLHLRKAVSGLENSKILTVGALVDAAVVGIGPIRSFGAVAHDEVMSALSTLARSIDEGGWVDWEEYARFRGFSLIPETEPVPDEAALGKILPELCRRIVAEQFKERDQSIFEHRFLKPPADTETLQSLGDVFGISRERIRQVEAKCLEAIRRPLIEADYRGLNFRLRDEFIQLFRDAWEHFDSFGVSAWRQSVWFAELESLWHLPAEKLSHHARLLSLLLGYESESPGSRVLEPLMLAGDKPAAEGKALLSQVSALYEVLVDEPKGLEEIPILKQFAQRKIPAPKLGGLNGIAELCSAVEKSGTCYRLEFAAIRSRVHQGIRLLHEAGEPMHYRDVLREINRRVPPNRRLSGKENLVNQWSGDDRLQPIGKSGHWALAEWGIETRSLVKVIEDVLQSAGEALPLDAIVERVLAVRSGAESSVKMLMDFKPEKFRRLGLNIYGLTEWGENLDEDEWWSNDAVAQFVQEFFDERKVDTVEFRDLRLAFSETAGLGSRSASGILAYHPILETERSDDWRTLARIRPDWKNFQRMRRRGADRQTQAELIVEKIQQRLADCPSGELPLIELVKEIAKELNVIRQTVYGAVAAAEELETIPVDGSAFKICREVGRARPAYPAVERITILDWQSECHRGVERLTLEDVDIGLFILGRQFDAAMEQLLVAARNSGQFTVTEGQIKTLNNRIEWALRHEVLTDRTNLNLLRVERNERGHKPPALEERRSMMKFAPYLAELYLDYLLLIQEQISRFAAESNP